MLRLTPVRLLYLIVGALLGAILFFAYTSVAGTPAFLTSLVPVPRATAPARTGTQPALAFGGRSLVKVISVNQELMRDPSLLAEDPYKNGWICVVKAPEISTNLNNLMRGPLVGPWLENSQRRLVELTAQSGITAMADGGMPVKGMLTHLDPGTQRAMIKEFFLT